MLIEGSGLVECCTQASASFKFDHCLNPRQAIENRPLLPSLGLRKNCLNCIRSLLVWMASSLILLNRLLFALPSRLSAHCDFFSDNFSKHKMPAILMRYMGIYSRSA